MDLSIIFVNWNSTDYLRDCLRSIYQHTCSLKFEVIIVDNASPVGGVETLTEEFPESTLIKSAENLGFARANNLGFRASKGRYILFLNPDTVLLNPALNVMLDRIQSLPGAGIVGCKLLNDDGSVQTSCIQRFPTILNQVLDIDMLRNRFPACPLWAIDPLFTGKTEPSRVEVVSGACLMIKREVFEQVGGYSEDYFMYAEDLDLCYKVVRSGHVNYYVPEGTVVHYGGKSSTPQWATVMKWKSILHYCIKNHGWGYTLVFRIVMALAAMGRLTIFMGLSVAQAILGRMRTGYSSTGKWLAILKVMLTESGRDFARSS